MSQEAVYIIGIVSIVLVHIVSAKLCVKHAHNVGNLNVRACGIIGAIFGCIGCLLVVTASLWKRVFRGSWTKAKSSFRKLVNLLTSPC